MSRYTRGAWVNRLPLPGGARVVVAWVGGIIAICGIVASAPLRWWSR